MKARTDHKTRPPVIITQLVLLECVGDMSVICDQNIRETTTSSNEFEPALNQVCTSDYVKLRILALLDKGCHVVRELSREGIRITRTTVGKFFKKFRDKRRLGLCDLLCSGCQKSI